MLPVMHSRNPMSIYLEEAFEPQYAKKSTEYLREYKPTNPGLKKAKSYWLNLEKYSADPMKRERIWEEYPNEIKSVRSLVGIIHKKICNDAVINRGYYRNPRPPEGHPVPNNFIKLEDYFLFEERDSMNSQEEEALAYFLSHSIHLCARDKTWALSREDLQEISKLMPHKIEPLKTLLWQRHICLQEHREFIAAYFRAEMANYLQQQKPVIIAITSISVIAGVVLAALAFACAQPFLLIPAAISVVISIVTPAIYIYRRVFYECE